MANLDEQVRSFRRRIDRTVRSQPADLLTDGWLDEAAKLVRLVDSAEPVGTAAAARADLLVALGWLHWERYGAGPAAKADDLLAALPLFGVVAQFDPRQVPPDIRESSIEAHEQMGHVELEPGLIPGLWDGTAAELIEDVIVSQEHERLDAAVYLLERAIACSTPANQDLSRYRFNLATALHNQALFTRDEAAMWRALEAADAALKPADGDEPFPWLHKPDDRPATRLATRANIARDLYHLTDDVKLLESAVWDYRTALRNVPHDHVDYAGWRLHYADTLRTWYAVTHDNSAADMALAQAASVRHERARDGLSTWPIDTILRSVISGRFADADPGVLADVPQRHDEPEIVLPWRAGVGEDDAWPLQSVAAFEATGDPAYLRLSDDRARQIREAVSDALARGEYSPEVLACGWLHWYRFLCEPASPQGRASLADATELLAPLAAEWPPGVPEALRHALDEAVSITRFGVPLETAAVAYELQRPETAHLKPGLADFLLQLDLGRLPASAAAIVTGYRGIAYDQTFHMSGDRQALPRARGCLEQALGERMPEPVRGVFLEAYAGVIADYAMLGDDVTMWDQAIAVSRQAVDAAATPDSPLPPRWHALGRLLLQRYLATDDLAFAAQAFDVVQHSVDIADDDSDRDAGMRLLVEAHTTVGFHADTPEGLAQVVEFGSQRLRQVPSSSAQHLSLCGMVGSAMATLSIEGAEVDPDEAIGLLALAADGIPERHLDAAYTFPFQLASLLANRFDRARRPADAHRAIVAYAEVATGCQLPEAQAVALTRLGMLLRKRSDTAALLDAAVSFLRHACDLAREEGLHPLAAEQLALALVDRFHRDHHRGDLDDAVPLLRVSAQGLESVAAARRLAEVLLMRYRISGSADDLAELDAAATAWADHGDQADPDLQALRAYQVAAHELQRPLTLAPPAMAGRDQAQASLFGAYESLVAQLRRGGLDVEQARAQMPPLPDDAAGEGFLSAALAQLDNADLIGADESLIRRVLLHAAVREFGLESANAAGKARVHVALLEGLQQADVPDPELFELGYQAGLWAIAYADGRGDHASAGVAHLRTASMFCQFAMLAGDHQWLRRSAALAIDLRRFQQWAVLTGDGAAPTINEPIPYRTATEALRAALHHARQATALCAGWERVQAHRRLALILIQLRDVGDRIEESELHHATRVALSHVGDQHLLYQAELIRGLPAAERATAAQAIADKLMRPQAEVFDQDFKDALAYTAFYTAQALLDPDPRAGWQLVTTMRRRIQQDVRAGVMPLLRLQCALASRLLAPDWQPPDDAVVTAETAAQQWQLVHDLTVGSAPARLGHLLAFATWAAVVGADADVSLSRLAIDGLEEIGRLSAAEDAEGSLSAELPTMKLYLRTHLRMRLAAELDPAAQVPIIAEIAQHFWDLGARGQALDTVGYLSAIASHIDSEDVPMVLVHLGTIARFVPAGVDQRVFQTVYARILGAGLTTGINSVDLDLLVGQANGARLGELLLAGPPALPHLDHSGHDMLADIHRAEAHVPDPAETVTDDDTAEWITVAWADEVQRRPGDSATGRLLNMQRRFDRQLFAQTFADRLPLPFTMLKFQLYQRALDERTVLLIQTHMLTGEHKPGLAHLIITADGITVMYGWHPIATGDIRMVGDLSYTMPELGIPVADVRRALRSDPGAAVVNEDAEDNLADGIVRLLVGSEGVTTFDALRQAGKDRLLVVPYGPFHYYPMHLIGPAGRPVFHDWDMAYLPHADLLIRAPGEQRPHTAMSSIGLSYTAPAHAWLPGLGQAVAEAQQCAAAFGATALIDAEATKSSVLQALRTSRYVHIAAHGTHNPDAPAFQTLHLAPSHHDDGRLFMHELLTETFSNVELVTLSACQTALGRVDRAGNVIGIPTALLLAGVRTIVATMWPVADEVAAHFFPTLYHYLARRNDTWAAFRAAQTDTRRWYPQYRDWGAFILIGVPDNGLD